MSQMAMAAISMIEADVTRNSWASAIS